MSGQSSILEQESGMQGLSEPSTAAAGCVSFRAGKKVRCSQSCSPPSWSSLASVPTSHRILGSVRIWFVILQGLVATLVYLVKRKRYFPRLFYLRCHFCFPPTCCSSNTTFLAPVVMGRDTVTGSVGHSGHEEKLLAFFVVVPVWIFSAPFCGCVTWSGLVLRQHLEPIRGSAARRDPARTRLSPSAARLLFSTTWNSLSHNQ